MQVVIACLVHGGVDDAIAGQIGVLRFFTGRQAVDVSGRNSDVLTPGHPVSLGIYREKAGFVRLKSGRSGVGAIVVKMCRPNNSVTLRRIS